MKYAAEPEARNSSNVPQGRNNAEPGKGGVGSVETKEKTELAGKGDMTS